MPRVKIKFPENNIFKTELTVSIEHINYGNHVGNDRFLGFCHEARIRFLDSIEQSELTFFECSLIMADAELSFKKQSYRSDVLTIELAIGDVSSHSFELLYRMKNQANELVCLAKTSMVYFDYKSNKVSKCPNEWEERLVGLN